MESRKCILILIIGLLILTFGLTAQNKEKNTMHERFDIESFLENNPHGLAILDTLANGDDIEYDRSTKGGYIKIVISKNTPYKYYKEYDEKGRLIRETTSYYRFGIGKGYYYDENGNILHVENFDEPYQFTLSNLIEKMKKEFDLDITVRVGNNIDIFRNAIKKNGEDFIFYKVEYYDPKDDKEIKYYYIIDGTTGKTLYEKVRPFRYGRSDGYAALDDYFKELENKEK